MHAQALDVAKRQYPFRAAYRELLQGGQLLVAAVLYLDCVENAPELNVEVVEIVGSGLPPSVCMQDHVGLVLVAWPAVHLRVSFGDVGIICQRTEAPSYLAITPHFGSS